MSSRATRLTDKLGNRECREFCQTCGNTTEHTVVESVAFDEESGDTTFRDEHQIIQCGGCKTGKFRLVLSNDDNFEIDEHTGEKLYTETVADVFPMQFVRPPLGYVEILPSRVGRIYTETVMADAHGLPVLAAVGLRALVEAVCKERKATGQTLKDRIDKLVPHVITAREAATLHRLRFLGNDAVHEIKPPSAKTLDVALDVVEHMLRGVYVVPQKARKGLPRKRKKASA